jgi:putative RecB family exonuclease
MPRNLFSGTLHVSASQVSTYLTCPERFRLQYVECRPPSHRSGDLVFGSAIHGALAEFHQGLQEKPGEPMPLDQLCGVFDRQMAEEQQGTTPVMWEDADGPEKMSAVGHGLLELYRETVQPHRVLAVEQPFSIPRKDPVTSAELDEQIVGVVDVVEEDTDGVVWITELKTAAKRFDDTRLSYDHQATIYGIARPTLGYPTARVRFRVMLKTKKPAIETYNLRRDTQQFAETRRVVHQVLRAVDAGIYYPIRGWQCANCAFRATCGT